MNHEDKKMWLNGYRDSLKSIRKAKLRLEELKLDERYPKAIEYSDMPKGSCKDKDLSDYMVKLENAKECIEKCKIESAQKKEEIINKIEELEDTEQRLILKLRYVQMDNTKKICKKMSCGRATMFRIQNKAINNLENFEEFEKVETT